MNGFDYHHGHLYCEQTDVRKIVESVGTPCYVYSYTTFIENYKAIADAFAKVNPLIAYSVKANSNGAICRALFKEGAGAGADVVSGGELQRALAAGVEPQKVVFAGVGKTSDEIRLAIEHDILMFNVESLPEAYVISEIASSHSTTARVALRVNPDVDPDTHEYITTGKKENKFGIGILDAPEILSEMNSLEGIDLIGLHMHIGSQIMKPDGYVTALRRIEKLMENVRRNGISIQSLNLGGGFGIDYETGDTPMSVADLADALVPVLASLDCRIILEPGRYIIGPAGMLLTRVTYVKNSGENTFVIVDGAMNDLLRPTLYSAYHRILPLRESKGTDMKTVDVVGPICETGDFFARDRELPAARSGDFLAVMDAGAYGYTMSSNYNSRPRGAEVIVKNSKYFVIKEREKLQSLTKGEKIPPFLK